MKLLLVLVLLSGCSLIQPKDTAVYTAPTGKSNDDITNDSLKCQKRGYIVEGIPQGATYQRCMLEIGYKYSEQ